MRPTATATYRSRILTNTKAGCTSAPNPDTQLPRTRARFQEFPPEVNRTELNRTEEKQSYSSEPYGSSPSASPANSQGLIHIPLNTGEEFPVTESMAGEFRSLY